MKKLFVFLTVLSLMSGLLIPAYAQGNNVATEVEYIATQKLMSFGTYTVSDYALLYNTNLEAEAACVSFAPTGYVVVNLNDYSIPEFSPYNESPFADTETDSLSVYVGPLNYFAYTENGEYINLINGDTFAYDDFDYAYSEQIDNEVKENTVNNNGRNIRGSSVSVRTNAIPSNWYPTRACGVVSSAIVLKYIDQYHSSSLLNSSMDSQSTLYAYLIDNNYLADDGSNGSALVYGYDYSLKNENLGYYTGLNDFFADRGSAYRAQVLTYTANSYVDIMGSVSNNMPVIIGTTNAITINSYKNHWMVVYGFYWPSGEDPYIEVVDGLGHYGVYIDLNDSYFDEVILFDK